MVTSHHIVKNQRFGQFRKNIGLPQNDNTWMVYNGTCYVNWVILGYLPFEEIPMWRYRSFVTGCDAWYCKEPGNSPKSRVEQVACVMGYQLFIVGCVSNMYILFIFDHPCWLVTHQIHMSHHTSWLWLINVPPTICVFTFPKNSGSITCYVMPIKLGWSVPLKYAYPFHYPRLSFHYCLISFPKS